MSIDSRRDANKVNKEPQEPGSSTDHDDPAAQNLVLEAEIKSIRERLLGKTAIERRAEQVLRDVRPSEPVAEKRTTATAPFAPKRILDEFPRREPNTPEKQEAGQDALKTENERLRREITGLNEKIFAQDKRIERVKTLRQRLAEVEAKRQAVVAAMADLERELTDFGGLLKDDEVAGNDTESKYRDAAPLPNPASAREPSGSKDRMDAPDPSGKTSNKLF